MRFISIIGAALVAAACSSSTSPVSKAGDPSLLFTNNLPNDYVYITWQDGNAIIGKDSIPPHTANQCVRFTAQPDSARWVITASETPPGGSIETSSETAPWFNPAARPAWNVRVDHNATGSPSIFASDTTAAC
jgi:hypothetical protein